MRRALALCAMAALALALPAAARAERPPPPACKDLAVAHDGDGEPAWSDEGAVPGAIYVRGEGLADLDMFIALVAKSRGRAIIIEGGNFEGWDFSIVGPPIVSVCFRNARLARSTWHRETYAGIGFVDSDLTRANFSDAALPGVLLENVILEGTDMAGAALERGIYRAGWDHSADKWDLTGANLREFRFICGIEIFDGCPLGPSGISLAGADLTRADLSLFRDWSDADLTGARLDGTIIAPRQIPQFVLADAAGEVVLRGGAYRIAISPAELRELQHAAGEHAAQASDPSFPCHRAATPVETIICGEYETALRQRDRDMAWLYARAREADPGEAVRQKAWLASRNRCRDADCLRQSYDARIDRLSAALAPPDPAFGGQAAYFMHETLPVSRAFRDGPLYHKILPALVGDADIGAVVQRQADGRFAIAGKALGANAHICTILASDLAFDPASGWFVQQDSDGGSPVRMFQLIDQSLHIIRDGHPEFDHDAPVNLNLSCGMRAAFAPMTRIAAEPAHLAAMMRFFEF